MEDFQKLGNEEFSKKNFQLAIEWYTKGLEKSEKNHLLLNNRATCYFQLGDFVSAARDAQKCIEICPTFVKGYFRFATSLLKLRDFNTAKALISRALEMEPNNEGCIKLQKEIETEFQNYIRTEKNRENVVRHIITQRGQSRVELEKINMYLGVVADNIDKLGEFDSKELLKSVGKIKNTMHDEKYLDLLKDLNGKACFYLGIILYQAGILDMTIPCVEKYLETEPKDVDALVVLALCRYYQRISGDREFVHKAILINPSHVFAIRAWIDIFALHQIEKYEDCEMVLGDISLINNSGVVLKQPLLIEIGLKAWYFLLNNRRGSIGQLKEILDQSSFEESFVAVKKIFNSHTSEGQPLIKVLNHPFILNALQTGVLYRLDLDKLFTLLRRCFLSIGVKDTLDLNVPLLMNIAHQVSLQEYAWCCTVEEKSSLATLKNSIEGILRELKDEKWELSRDLQLSLVFYALYRPLHTLKHFERLALINRKPLVWTMSLLLKQQVRDVLEELKHVKRLKSPFPQWRTLSTGIVKVPYPKFIEWNFPSTYWPQGTESGSNMLIVGCITGKNVFQYPLRFSDCRVYGIDACEDKISFGKRQSKELGLNSDHLFCCKYLDYQSSISYDAIEMNLTYETRVENLVHHFLGLAKEGCIFKITVMSRRMSDLIISARGVLENENKINLENASVEELQNARDILISKQHASLSVIDIYNLRSFEESLSSTKTECFDFAKIFQLVESAKLKFISLDWPASAFDKYVKEFPTDSDGKSPSLIEKFDEKFRVFSGPISFYCEKPSHKIEEETNDPMNVKSFLLKRFKK